MGFESFTVLLTPCQDSPLRHNQDVTSATGLATEIQNHWSSLCPDDRERDEIAQYVRPGDTFLFSETEAGLYQMLLQTSTESDVQISLRFALCNPRTVYSPFCRMVSWLMRRYQMRCRGLFYVPPGSSIELCDPDEVEETLTSHMDENRRLWQLDAGTEEEARLRPSDAFVQLYFPHLTAA